MMANWFKKKPVSDEGRWLLVQSEEENLLVLFRLRDEKPPGIRVQHFPFLINIYWRFEDSSHGGMPSEHLLKQMGDLEERLDQIEGADNGYMVLSITGNHRKEWIWYVKNKKVFVRKLNQALKGHDVFPIELQAAEDPTWQNYEQLRNTIKSS